ncbi:MAG: hypothetical protein AAFO61_01750 [Pseudomonadota bacterium]
MSNDTENHTLRLLREIRASQKADTAEISRRLIRLERNIEDMATGVWKSSSLSMKSDARLDNTDERIEELEARLAKLEEKA